MNNYNFIKHNDKEIKGFYYKYRFLSNFTCSPIVYKKLVFATVENAFQASKVLTTDNESLFEEFVLMTPEMAKKIGKKVVCREDWNDVKYQIMRDLVYAKFETHNELLYSLLKTKDAYLEETNNWNDRIWGVDAKSGEGSNWLGKILMDVRSEFQGYEKAQLELFN